MPPSSSPPGEPGPTASRPHMPDYGVSLDGTFHFSTGGRSRKARNLAEDPRCAVSLDRADESVVVEGIAERTTGLPGGHHPQPTTPRMITQRLLESA